MGYQRYNGDTLQRLYQIGGADLALRYRDIAESSSFNDSNDYELKILSLRFFNSGNSITRMADRQFMTRFSQRSAKFISFQLEMNNPWRYTEYSYNLLARYYYPNGILMGEIESRFKTNPRWYTLLHSAAWGWEEAGHWPLGDYRVKFYIGNEYRITEKFTIF